MVVFVRQRNRRTVPTTGHAKSFSRMKELDFLCLMSVSYLSNCLNHFPTPTLPIHPLPLQASHLAA